VICKDVLFFLFVYQIAWPRIVTNYLWIKPTDSLNSNFICVTTLHVSGSPSVHHREFLALHRHWYILCSFDDRLLPVLMTVYYQEQDGTGCSCISNYIRFHPAPGSKRSSKLHKLYQYRCTAKNSWWWAERLPETCRVVIPIKLDSSPSGFIHKEFVYQDWWFDLRMETGSLRKVVFCFGIMVTMEKFLMNVGDITNRRRLKIIPVIPS
jgi:hypothetical protein